MSNDAAENAKKLKEESKVFYNEDYDKVYVGEAHWSPAE